jgi:hypothetical protein
LEKTGDKSKKQSKNKTKILIGYSKSLVETQKNSAERINLK